MLVASGEAHPCARRAMCLSEKLGEGFAFPQIPTHPSYSDRL